MASESISDMHPTARERVGCSAPSAEEFRCLLVHPVSFV